MGYPPERGRLSTRYSPVRHFTRPANRAFSCDLHVLGMPPALILSQDQTLQFYLEFSRTRTHYLVFKEQVLVLTIVTIPAPLSRGLFFRLTSCPPRAATVFLTQAGFPVNPCRQFIFCPQGSTRPPSRQPVIYIQSPPPCQAPLGKKATSDQLSGFRGNCWPGKIPARHLSPLFSRGARGDYFRPSAPLYPLPKTAGLCAGQPYPPLCHRGARGDFTCRP